MKLALALFLISLLNRSFEYKDTNPLSLFPYYVAVSDTNPLGYLANPAYLPLYNTAYFSIDYGKPYMMSDLDSGNIRAGFSSHNAGIQAAWNRFGIEGYSEDIIEGNAGYSPWKFISIGLGASYYRIDINVDGLQYKKDITDARLAVLLMPFDWFHAGYIQENIYRSVRRKYSGGRDYDILYPAWGFGAGTNPARGISFAWNINKVYFGYINSFSVTANMLPCLSLKGGYSHETSSYSLAVNVLYSKFSISYGLSHQTYLGLTHKIGIIISSNDLSVESLNYNKKLFKESLPARKKKINVNYASLEELTESGIFEKEIGERIIKYREAFGPITETGLIQIGYPYKEFKDSKEYILGLAEEPVKNEKYEAVNERKPVPRNKIKTKTGYNVETRKLLFQKLLENGLSAGTALKIAERAKTGSKADIMIFINDLQDIDNENKKRLSGICDELL